MIELGRRLFLQLFGALAACAALPTNAIPKDIPDVPPDFWIKWKGEWQKAGIWTDVEVINRAFPRYTIGGPKGKVEWKVDIYGNKYAIQLPTTMSVQAINYVEDNPSWQFTTKLSDAMHSELFPKDQPWGVSLANLYNIEARIYYIDGSYFAIDAAYAMPKPPPSQFEWDTTPYAKTKITESPTAVVSSGPSETGRTYLKVDRDKHYATDLDTHEETPITPIDPSELIWQSNSVKLIKKETT